MHSRSSYSVHCTHVIFNTTSRVRFICDKSGTCFDYWYFAVVVGRPIRGRGGGVVMSSIAREVAV